MSPVRRLRTALRRFIPSPVRQFLRHRISSGERLADITSVTDLQRELEEHRSNRVWLDVGAYRGEMTLPWARRYSNLIVYAFEPNIRLAALLPDAFENFVVITAAVAEQNGIAPFFVTRYAGGGSLLRLDSEAQASWIGGESLSIIAQRIVPTIRLDTFLDRMKIAKVDLLKIDAQGSDLAVVASAGERINDITTIVLEVAITSRQVYKGAANRETTISFLEQRGFELVHVTTGNHDQEQNLTFQRKSRTARNQMGASG